MGRFLRQARLAANLSQTDVRKILAYKSPQLISDWERGICSAPHRVLPKLIKIYEIDPKEFIKIYLIEYEKELKKVLRETQDHKLRS